MAILWSNTLQPRPPSPSARKRRLRVQSTQYSRRTPSPRPRRSNNRYLPSPITLLCLPANTSSRLVLALRPHLPRRPNLHPHHPPQHNPNLPPYHSLPAPTQPTSPPNLLTTVPFLHPLPPPFWLRPNLLPKSPSLLEKIRLATTIYRLPWTT